MKRMAHPSEYSDTDPRVMEYWLELQRKMPAGEKLAATFAASQFVLQMYEMGVRSQYPAADDDEVRRRVAARQLPRDLVIRAYGWDPGADDDSR